MAVLLAEGRLVCMHRGLGLRASWISRTGSAPASRPPRSSPAPGSHGVFKREQEALVAEAIRCSDPKRTDPDGKLPTGTPA